MNGFKDQIAIVTGGASGIGAALARELAARGAVVQIADVQMDAALGVAAKITAAGGRASAHYLDVSDREAVARLVARIAAEQGRLDYMFNNAGIVVLGEFRDLPAADWKRTLDVNVSGVFAGTAAAYAQMIRQRSGHIVNTASVGGLIPSPGLAAYCASKHAVVGLSTSLRLEAAEYGVKVSVVCPGFVNTPIFDSKTVGMRADVAAQARRRMLRIAMTPEECARQLLDGVAKNRAVIAVTGHAKVLRALQRFFPGLLAALNRRIVRQVQRQRIGEPSA